MIKKIARALRLHFGFSQNELRGMFVLLFLILLILITPSIYREYLLTVTDSASDDLALIQEWKKEISESIPERTKPEFRLINKEFDPNTISSEEWISRGFKPKIVQRIQNYLTKGGQFREKNDLKKIYGINQKLVKRYEPFISIPPISFSRKETPKKASKRVYEKPHQIVNSKPVKLNTADTTSLQSIKGIGSYWSKRLVNYREALGGFIDKKQVRELYGIPDEIVEILMKKTTFDTILVKKINLNQDKIKALSGHPYISYKTAKSIIKYRKQHGNYQQLEELKEIVTMTDSLYQKIIPYLSVDGSQ